MNFIGFPRRRLASRSRPIIACVRLSCECLVRAYPAGGFLRVDVVLPRTNPPGRRMSGTPNALATEIAERYAIECVIGHGATAIVYRARDRREDRIVAIKVLRTELSQAAAIRRFLREIRRHSGLHHPNILQVLD